MTKKHQYMTKYMTKKSNIWPMYDQYNDQKKYKLSGGQYRMESSPFMCHALGQPKWLFWAISETKNLWFFYFTIEFQSAILLLFDVSYMTLGKPKWRFLAVWRNFEPQKLDFFFTEPSKMAIYCIKKWNIWPKSPIYDQYMTIFRNWSYIWPQVIYMTSLVTLQSIGPTWNFTFFKNKNFYNSPRYIWKGNKTWEKRIQEMTPIPPTPNKKGGAIKSTKVLIIGLGMWYGMDTCIP